MKGLGFRSVFSAHTYVVDAGLPNEDAIAGYSSIGFGVDGHTEYPLAIGACCINVVYTPELPIECVQMGGTFYDCTDCDRGALHWLDTFAG